MRPADSHIKIDYFHSCSDEMVDLMGIDGSLIPTRADWMAFYEEDALRPIELRQDASASTGRRRVVALAARR